MDHRVCMCMFTAASDGKFQHCDIKPTTLCLKPVYTVSEKVTPDNIKIALTSTDFTEIWFARVMEMYRGGYFFRHHLNEKINMLSCFCCWSVTPPI